MSDKKSGRSAAVVDREALLKRVDSDVELLQDLVDLFLEDLPERMESIFAALDEYDLEVLHEAAHALKGSVSNFAAPAAFEAAKQVSDLSRTGDWDGLKPAVQVLAREVRRLPSALREIVESA